MSLPVLKSKIIGSGRPLVLLHAFPLSNLIWKDFPVPSGVQLILPDFPGFGSSPFAEPGLLLEDAAQGLRRHLEEIGVKGLILLGGISMGGYWALEYMRQYQEQVDGLVLISTKAGVDKPEARQKRLETAKRVEEEGTEWLVDALIPGLLGKTTREKNLGVVQTVTGWIRESSPRAIAFAQRAMANRRDQNDLLSNVKVKTLVIAGLEDTLIPSTEAETMAREIPKARLNLIPGTGHLIPLESPSEFQKNLQEFFNP